MALQPISRIVNNFLVKWLILPAAAFLLVGTILAFIRIESNTSREHSFYVQSTARYVTTYLRQAEEDILYLLDLSDNPDRFKTELEHFVKAKSFYQRILLLNREGIIIMSAPDQQENLDYSGIFSAYIFNEKTFFTPPYHSSYSNQIVVGITRASPSGRIVLIELNLVAMQNYINELTGSLPHSYAFITDSFGNILAHPNPSLVEEQVNIGALELFTQQEKNNQGNQGFFRIRDRLQYMSSAGIPFARWKVVIARDAFSIFSPLLFSLALILVLLFVILAIMRRTMKRQIQKKIVTPLTAFSRMVEELQTGDEGEGPRMGIELEQLAFSELYSLHQNFIEMHAAVVQRERELRTSEQKLKRALKEKETLLQEMHHRVKNNLNVVASLLSLQADQVETVNDACEALLESRNRIYSMAMIHENLYKTDNFSQVNMDNYIKTMLYELVSYYSKEEYIRVETNVADIYLDIVQAVPCGIIINELFTNALKYGFPDNRKGIIRVEFSCEKERGHYHLRVTDDGVGLPDNFDLDQIESLGLHLVKILTNQLDGVFLFNSNGETEFSISFACGRS